MNCKNFRRIATLIILLCLCVSPRADATYSLVSPTFLMVFGNAGVVASAVTRYLYPGSVVASITEVKIRIPRAMVLTSIGVHSTTAPGGGLTDVFTVNKNGTATALTVSLAATDIDETTTTNVSFAAGDLLSVQMDTALASADTDPMVVIEGY